MPSSAPPGIGLVCHGHHPWSPVWKRNQSLFWALGQRPWVRQGLFVNPPMGWRNLPHGASYPTSVQWHASRQAVIPRRLGPGLRAWTPFDAVPLGRWRPARDANHALRDRLRAWLSGPPPHLVVLNDPFIDQGTAEALVADASFVVFDLSDDFVAYTHGGDEAARARTAARCNWMARRADVVLAVNAALAESYRRINAHTYIVPNACHYERFAACSDPGKRATPAVAELASRYDVVVGYYGWMMSHRIDVSLLTALIDDHPGWGFAFLGPADATITAALVGRPNVRLWHTVPQERLADYVVGFDVCLVPHLINVHSASNDPLKLYEYLAAGKPVVATPLPGLERFGDLVTIARTAAEFAAAIEQALVADGLDRRLVRQQVARANSWTARAVEVERIVAEVARQRGPVAVHAAVAARARATTPAPSHA